MFHILRYWAAIEGRFNVKLSTKFLKPDNTTLCNFLHLTLLLFDLSNTRFRKSSNLWWKTRGFSLPKVYHSVCLGCVDRHFIRWAVTHHLTSSTFAWHSEFLVRKVVCHTRIWFASPSLQPQLRKFLVFFWHLIKNYSHFS